MKETKAGKQRMRKRLIELAIQEAVQVNERGVNIAGMMYDDLIGFSANNPVAKKFPHKEIHVLWRRRRHDGSLSKGRFRKETMTNRAAWTAFRDKWRSLGIDVAKRGIPLVEREQQ